MHVVISSVIVQTWDDLSIFQTDYLPIISWFIATDNRFENYNCLPLLLCRDVLHIKISDRIDVDRCVTFLN